MEIETAGNLDTLLEENLCLRFLLYGPAKTKKTWWMLSAAECGFNVIVLECDDGWQIAKNLSPEARKRVTVIRIHDTKTEAVASIFLTAFLRGLCFAWDNDARKIVTNKNYNPEHTVILIDPAKVTPNDVIGIDSWTRNVHSVHRRYCIENNIDMASAEESGDRWEGYRWGKAITDWQLSQIHDFNCHFIIIGHQQIYEKSHEEKQGKKRIRIVDSTRIQPISTSGPNAGTMAAHFSDVLYFTTSGELSRISSKPAADRDGGSRIIPPADWTFRPTGAGTPDNLQLDWTKLCKLAQITPPTAAPASEAFKVCPPGAEIDWTLVESALEKAMARNRAITKAAVTSPGSNTKIIENSTAKASMTSLFNKPKV